MKNRHNAKNKKRWVIAGTLLAVFVFFLIPVVFNAKSRPPLLGPSLSELSYTEVNFNNEALQLAGMMFLPEAEEPYPVVVIIHGSGTSRRESKWYLAITKHLIENGIAVLLPDKRGSEKSEGEWRGSSFEELAGDTLSAVDYVKNQDQFEHSVIGLVGMSQGGWIAPLAASKSENLAFVVSMSGAGVTTDEQLLFEEVNNIAGMGAYRFLAEWIAPMTTRNIQGMDFWAPIAGFDPLPFWEQVQVPAFAALGENDQNVPVEASIQRFESLEKDILIKVYPDGGHGITDPITGEVQAEYLLDMVGFIKSIQQQGPQE